MLKNLAIALSLTGAPLMFFSCNSDYESTVVTESSAVVSAFSLTEDDDVLANLDSVYFSIDLKTAQIYNADSLPYGTKVTHLVPVITTLGASVAELSIPRGENRTDSVVDYLTNSTDSVDFSHGAVKLRLVSEDGLTERTYSIKVNVHQVKTDSLTWSHLQTAQFPSVFQVINSQKTVQQGNTIYCLTSYDGRYNIASGSDPALGVWDNSSVSFNFDVDIDSFTATDDALYILDKDGNLYTSADKGLTWTSTGQKADYLYGNYGSTLLASQKDAGGKWWMLNYPSLQRTALDSNFPVSGTSQTINYTFEWSSENQVLMTGGRLASGELTGSTWGYDGSSWTKLSSTSLPYGVEDMTVVPYYTVKSDTTNWTATRYSALIAMFGRRAGGTLNDTVYVSHDFGMHWEKANDELQIPSSIPSRYMAQGFVYSSTLTESSARSISDWTNLAGKKLPAWCSLLETGRSRATSLLTEWECPYIYVFGGKDAAGGYYNSVWRGVIRRFTFKPIQ